jgi:hypothetical protein
MLEFSDQTGVVTTASGQSYRSAGSPTLFARLARIVLWDGKFALAVDDDLDPADALPRLPVDDAGRWPRSSRSAWAW